MAQLHMPPPLQELMQRTGAGVACVVAAALPQRYLQPEQQQREELAALQQQCGSDARKLRELVLQRFLPPRELEFDMRGCAKLLPGRLATIDIGECKSSADYSSAVPQLGLRLAVLRWVLQHACDSALESVVLVGRMFVVAGRDGVDSAQQQRASDEWGFELLVHWV